jgi:photosystem II stability/assembly factor-like uncharacterized protein
MRTAQAASHVLDVATLSTPTKDMVWLVVHLSRPDNTRIKSFVLHSSDGGQSWREQLVETEHRLLGICFVNTEIGWVSGSGGLILRTIDGGRTWARQKSGTASSLVQIRFRDVTTGWAMSDDGEMLVTTDGGFDWGVHEIEVDQWVNYFDFSDSLHGWVVGESTQGYQTTDGGTTWKSRGAELLALVDEPRIHTANFLGMEFTDSRVGYIAAMITPNRTSEEDPRAFRKGVVFKTTDAGASWTVVLARDGLELVGATFVGDDAWIIGTNGDEILHTTDGGKSWSKEAAPTIGAFRATYFIDAKTGWAIRGWFGSLLRTRDDGRTWTKLELPAIDD